MRALSFLIAFVFSASIAFAQDSEILKNDDIISLTKIGLDKTVIITKIKESDVDFDVSTDGLIKLGAEKVDPKVINAMMERNKEAMAARAEADNANNPLAMHPSGIYVHNKGENSLLRMDEASISNYSTSGGGFGGFGKQSSVAHLPGSKCRMRIDGGSDFYFYADGEYGNEHDWWDEDLTPNDFVIVKLREKDGDRVFVIGSQTSGAFTSSSKSGIPAEDMVDFEYKKQSDGVFQIILKEPLATGEYLFMHPEVLGQLFAFGID